MATKQALAAAAGAAAIREAAASAHAPAQLKRIALGGIDMTEPRKPPKATRGDTAHKAAKVALSAIPVVGGPAAELFAALVLPPLEKRRDEWMESVGQVLEQLEDQDRVKVEDLSDNEEFIDTVLQATQIALRNHQEEKREALRNAIRNTALGQTPGESLRQIFLRYIDELTEWHLRIVGLFDDPTAWYRRDNRNPPDLQMGALSHVIEHAFPPLRNARAIYDQLWGDLQQRGLLDSAGLHTTMSGPGLLQSRTSDLGKRFLRFVGSATSKGDAA